MNEGTIFKNGFLFECSLEVSKMSLPHLLENLVPALTWVTQIVC